MEEVHEPEGGKGFDQQALDRSKCEDCKVASRVTYVESIQVLICICDGLHLTTGGQKPPEGKFGASQTMYNNITLVWH